MGQWESTMAFGENPLVAELKEVVTLLQTEVNIQIRNLRIFSIPLETHVHQ